MLLQTTFAWVVKKIFFQLKKWLFELFHLYTAKPKFFQSEIKLLVDVADCR